MGELVVVASFEKPHEAELAANELRAADIDVNVLDANTVGANLRLSGALGGVKLQVPGPEAEEAREILEEVEDLDLSDEIPDDAFDEEFEEEFGEVDEEESEEWEEMKKGLHCPECGSKEVGIGSPTFHTYTAITLFALGGMFWTPPEYRQIAGGAFVLLFAGGGIAFFLRLFPVVCKECGHSGSRADFDPTVD